MVLPLQTRFRGVKTATELAVALQFRAKGSEASRVRDSVPIEVFGAEGDFLKPVHRGIHGLWGNVSVKVCFFSLVQVDCEVNSLGEHFSVVMIAL